MSRGVHSRRIEGMLNRGAEMKRRSAGLQWWLIWVTEVGISMRWIWKRTGWSWGLRRKGKPNDITDREDVR